MSDSISEFWHWFAEHESLFRKGAVPHSLIRQFEEKLFAIAELDWEIGPDPAGGACLAISPRDHLQDAQDLVEKAPRLAGWNIKLFKPPKEWDLRFDVLGKNGKIGIDANNWEFVVYHFDDGSFDIVFKPDVDCNEDLRHAAYTIVDSEIGEELRRQVVGEVSVVSEWTPSEAPRAKQLAPKLLLKLIQNHRKN
jgi:hypothetical protein